MESVTRTLPPRVRTGSCASIRWLKVFGTGPEPPILSAASGPGLGPGKM